MEHYGIRGVTNQLMSSYLHNRQQLVDWKGEKSQLKGIDQGVAQGSVLAAILFLIYINDLPNNISGSVANLFADDTSFLTKSTSRETLLSDSEDSLSQAGEWFSSNGLCLNVKKTQHLIISTKNSRNESLKFLGVHLNSHLKWTDHIQQLSSKLSSAIYAIRRVRAVSTFEAALTTYHACFVSRASYAILIWGSSPETDKVFRQQKDAVRALTMSGYRTACRELFKANRLLTIPSIYIYQALLCIHSSKEDLHPRRNALHNYPTRQNYKRDIPLHRLNRTQETTRFMSISIYNHLPEHYTTLTLKLFKRKIKDTLIANAFYSIEEYMKFKF